jgi:hypothetical protein
LEVALKKKLQIFISSTYTDLKEERQSAVSAILKAGHIPAGMELFTSGDESQMDTIKRWIDDSDIYMLILGGRYGSIEKTTSLSYTELEYDYAVENKKPFFAVVIDEKSLEEKIKDKGSEVLERDHPQELKLFREKVLSKISSFFEDPKDIKLAVHETISDFEARYDLKGWIHGDDIPDIKPIYDEIAHLRKKNEELIDQLEQQSKSIEQPNKNETKEEELEEIMEILRKIEIETNLFNKDESEESEKILLINLLIGFKDRLVTGVTNKAGMNDVSRLLYFNVCPKLQIHGLVFNEKVANVQYRRFALTKKGEEFLAYLDKKKL